MLTLVADLDGNRLSRVDVRGDFLIPRQNDLRDLTKDPCGQTLDGAQASVRDSSLPDDLRSALLKLLTELEMTDQRQLIHFESA